MSRKGPQPSMLQDVSRSFLVSSGMRNNLSEIQNIILRKQIQKTPSTDHTYTFQN